MKVYKNKIIIFILFSLSIIQIFSLLPSLVIGVSNINYTFNNEVLYDNNNISFDTYNNIRNPQVFTEIYNATYNFLNDTIGGNPSGWTINEPDSNTIQVISDLDSHKNVVEMVDNEVSSSPTMTTNFDGQEFGTIEFYMRITDVSESFAFIFGDGGTGDSIFFLIRSSEFQYYVAGYNTISTAVNNIWYHIRIDFETTVGSYEGLAQNKWRVYISGIEFGDYNFYGTPTEFDFIYTGSESNAVSGHTMYLDAIGYSWYNYTIGNNIIPYNYIVDTIIHQDTFAFDFENKSTLYTDNYNNATYSTWTEVEYNSIDNVHIKNDGSNVGVWLNSSGQESPFGENSIEKNFGLTSDIYNISYSVKILNADSLNSRIELNVYSSDSTLVSRIIIEQRDSGASASQLQQYDGGSDNVLTATDFINENEVNELNLYINYNDGLCVLVYYKDNVYVDSYIFPLIVNGKSGISKIELINDPSGSVPFDDDFNVVIDYIGVYENGLSISNDFAYTTLELSNTDKWYYVRQNIFKIQMEGNYEINPTLSLWNPFALDNLIIFNNITGYSSSLETYNIYDYYYNLFYRQFGISTPNLVFHIYGNNSYIIDSLKISGVSLSSEGNKFWQNFEHDNININDDYFYVDNSNNLRYSLTSDDSLLEFKQIYFNITQVSSTNRFITFSTSKTGNSFGNFIVGFNDDSVNVIEFINTKTNYQVIITQNKTISQLRILISDNDDFDSGITFGSVYNVILRFTTSGVSITILSLIGMMIPLIIIITPSLAISGNYGKNLIVPLFILMSIICLVGNIIPIWLFFIIGFSVLSFMFINKEGLSEVV